MKILLVITLILSVVTNNFASPLILKKRLSVINLEESSTELAVLDTAQYARIKIHLYAENNEYDRSKYPGDYTKDYQAGKFEVLIEGIENEDVFRIYYTWGQHATQIVELPPAKIRISVKGRGEYKLFIWGDR